MEHYYDEPTHVPSYQKKKYRTESMGFLNHVEIFRNFTIKYVLPLPQYTVYPDPNSKTNSFFLAQININEHFVIQAGPTNKLAENRAALKLLLLLLLLDLNPTTCKHPIFSNINPTFLFQPSEKPSEFP